MKIFSKIDKATKHYERVKQLDRDIIRLDKLALQIISSEKKANVSIELTEEQQEPTNDSCMYADGFMPLYGESTVFRYVGLDMMGNRPGPLQQKKLNVFTDLRDTTVLEIIGVLIARKTRERKQELQAIEMILK